MPCSVGTRFQEETVAQPKPMVEIGGKPILWHIMQHFAHLGCDEVFAALGYCRQNELRQTTGLFEHFRPYLAEQVVRRGEPQALAEQFVDRWPRTTCSNRMCKSPSKPCPARTLAAIWSGDRTMDRPPVFT